mmetsp:Transcript_11744/g.21808  ORF Transcript_11744/g.21808 Transcript_11744/m.21808 type:complete len:387 (-) Transcript_11744:70-1230(-)
MSSSMANSWKMNQLDFRFADEDDAEDIKSLINTVYVHEEEGQGEGGFRPTGDPKISLSELIDDFESPAVRWLLLETPRPEEAIIAALRMNVRHKEGLSRGVQYSVVDLFGSQEPPQQCSIINMLLNRAETVCRSLGHQKIVFEIPNWSEDRQRWLDGCGYSDLGGHAWPDDRQDEVTRYTMVLEYEKALMATSSIASPASYEPPKRVFPPPPIPASLLAGVEDDVIIDVDYNTSVSETEGSSNGSGGGSNLSDPMFPLISDLFTALHAEANNAKSTQPTNCASASTITSNVTCTSTSEGQEQLDLDGATVEVVHAGGSFLAGGDLTSMLSSLPLLSESSETTTQQNPPDSRNDQMTNLIGDLFSALHSEANDIANNFPSGEGNSSI